MANKNEKANMQYYLIPDYTMKCRLYPNKTAAKAIDDAIHAIHVFYNCTLYEMQHNHLCTKEEKNKDKGQKKIVSIKKYGIFDVQTNQLIDDANGFYYHKISKANSIIKHHDYKNAEVREVLITKEYENDSDTIHFADFKAVGSVEWKKKMIAEHPIISKVPSSAITCKSGIISDMKKSFEREGKTVKDKTKNNNPLEYRELQYYSHNKQRNSYSYQESLSKVFSAENINTLYISLAKIGTVKIKGWNQSIRFGEIQNQNFLEYAKNNPRQQVTVTVSKDNCGDYWICFKLHNVYKPMALANGKSVGVDVGVKDIAICSDGTKFENKKYKADQSKHKKAINRRLSRRYGWSNEKFRAEHRKDTTIQPSKRYEKTRLANAKLERKIAWRRNWYNHQITTTIISDNENIAVETLNISGMFRNKHLANALSDASMSFVLTMLSYKSEWYHRQLKSIDQWMPSSKRCSCCGYILPKLSLAVREWKCPQCNTYHDRDINAAKNIRYYAFGK